MQSESDFYDHYKETFAVQQGYLSERNKLTAAMLVLLVLLAGFIYDPAMLNDKVNQYVNSHVEGLAFEMKYLNTGIIFMLLWVITRYYQVVLQIEKMYHYLDDCEKKLSENGTYKVNREGAYYLKSYQGKYFDSCYTYRRQRAPSWRRGRRELSQNATA